MIYKILKYNLLFIPIFLSISCKDTNEYRVNDEFAPYVQKFIDEAALRGKTYDFEKTGLIIEFANLDNDVAGLCHYEDPIRIQIDKDYWNALQGTEGEELMKEDLIFHEMGHGILGRKHINDILENGDWKSIMCGGDKVDDRPWNINYRGFRRTYYLDELFNQSTIPGDSLSMQFLSDTTGFSRKIFLTFDSENKADAGWTMETNDNYSMTIDNARLKFQSNSTGSYFILVQTPVDILSDFVFDCKIQCSPNDITDNYGLIFGNTTNADIEYFMINNDQKMRMGNRLWYSFFTELSESAILPTAENKLTVMRKDNMLYYFINDVYVYCSEPEITNDGDQFGFIVPPGATVWLNDFEIKTSDSSAASVLNSKIISTGSKVEVLSMPPVNSTRNK